MNKWQILNISPTKDVKLIRKAYAELLKVTNPEDDPKGFEIIRQAYEEALDESYIDLEPISFSEAPKSKIIIKEPENDDNSFCPSRRVNDLMTELFFEKSADESLQIFKQWVKEGVFANLEISLAVQETMMGELLNLIPFPNSLFFAAFEKFNWQALYLKYDHPLASSLEEIIENHNLSFQLNLLEQAHNNPRVTRLMYGIILEDMELAVSAELGSLNAQNEMGNTALHLACRLNLATFVHYLIEKGADLSICNHEGQTPLSIAVQQDALQIVQLLIGAGADPEQRDNKNRAIFTLAILYAGVALVLFLANFIKIEAPPSHYYEAVSKALELGRFDIASQLLHSLDLTKEEQATIFFFLSNTALSSGYPSLVVEAHIMVPSKWPFNLPLVQEETLPDSLQAAYHGHLEKLRGWANQNNQLDTPDPIYNFTPIFLASKQGHLDCVRFLLDQGVNPNQTTYNGLSPLHVAIQYHHHEIVEALIVAGADVNLVEKPCFYSPLLMAVHYQNRIAFHRLLELDAKDPPSWFGHTALVAAVYQNDLESVKKLVEHGSNFKQTTLVRHFTLLYLAARYQHPEIVKYLLTLPLHPDWEPDVPGFANYDGLKNTPLTPLAAAIKNGDIESVQVLLEAGADPNRLNNGMSLTLFAKLSPEAENSTRLRNQYRHILNLLSDYGLKESTDQHL